MQISGKELVVQLKSFQMILEKKNQLASREIIIESINGFKEGGHIDIKSIIRDISGNYTNGTPSENKIIIDQTFPIISRMTIESSNGYPSKAMVGDEIVIQFQADEKIQKATFYYLWQRNSS